MSTRYRTILFQAWVSAHEIHLPILEQCNPDSLKLSPVVEITNRPGSHYFLGDVVHFACKSTLPYILIGPSSLTCQYDESDPQRPLKFVGTPPRCIRKQCANCSHRQILCSVPKCSAIPYLFGNGLRAKVVTKPQTPTHEDWVEGTVVRFQCPPGMSLRGDINTTCISTPVLNPTHLPVTRLAWNSDLPDCVCTLRPRDVRLNR